MKKRIAVGADGTGTTFAAIIEACQAGRLNAEVVLLFTNRAECGARKRAEALGTPTLVLRGDVMQKEQELLQALVEDHAPDFPKSEAIGGKSQFPDLSKSKAIDYKSQSFRTFRAPVDLVCLAGFLRMVPQRVVDAFRGRMLNSHPTLDMERFGGKGMYGIHVAEAEIRAGLRESGSTIHLVDEEYDRGAIVLQSSTLVPILSDDTPETLLARKMPQERELYIEAIAMLLQQ